jgi:hypothetical protein
MSFLLSIGKLQNAAISCKEIEEFPQGFQSIRQDKEIQAHEAHFYSLAIKAGPCTFLNADKKNWQSHCPA